ncbi:50S ribosomal protein L25/general stress protein Ctc [Evansella sp. LMS18]|uniref:50S ribosomal protein L25/general stress protein Ctc n=1 Tax=Evansella sp. LMS18 TaxID=2924033 RepID=UPI0020D1BD31|nr:50S ribosomal protein L25/general stress protein Ctc [Evansella sp. LMS18]UTR12445.1 50S ribosomal protein L25/general stress protein Ctc [Evansella sp. LMS18]
MTTVLEAAKRGDRRGSRLTKIREQGHVPGVVYGKAFGNESVTVDEIALTKTLRENGKNGVFKLALEGEQTDVIVYDLQMDSIKGEIVHVDFYALDMKSELDADVPVVTSGESAGVKDGGVLQQAVYELSVKALPNDIPENIEVDVSNLEVNDSIQVKDLEVEGKYTINNDPEEVIISILPPTEEPEEPGLGGETEEGAPALVDAEEGDEAKTPEEEAKEKEE